MTDLTSRLMTRTRRRLFIVTLGLVALLVVGIGAATSFVTLRALDADVDRALASTVEAAASSLHDGLGAGQSSEDGDEGVLASSDTFLLVLDPTGKLVSNPSRVSLLGLPDRSAVDAARATGRDIRSVEAGQTGEIGIRLLTVPISADHDGGDVIGYVQGGFVLALHDQQARSIVDVILVIGSIGLIGAAIVTLIVTDRALIPIRRSFAAQRNFVADASHELRTPAALIRATADVMDREGLVTDAGRSLVADIMTEADRLGRLVGDLLQLASTETTGIVIAPLPVDLAAIATDTVRQGEALASERGVHLAQVTTGPSPAMVSGDRDRLVQLLLILLENAFDHSPPDGTVSVDVRRSGHQVEMTVADEGPGIPPSERERVFEPFTRLPGVPRDGAGGTGLGLAIARRIATAHLGTIHASEAPGGGAALVVTIPAA